MERDRTSGIGFYDVNVASVADFLNHIQSEPFKDGRWAFRGQSRASWRLQPTIERLANDLGMTPHIEKHVERQFRRRAHHYLQDLPDDDDALEWIALMQHHGAPTRLLDWTKSAYVASFFAAEPATKAEPFAVWAVDREGIRDEAIRMLCLEGRDQNLASRENFQRLYRDSQPDNFYLIVPVQPNRMNDRLTIQQGLFLFSNFPVIGFEISLKSLLHHANRRNGAAVDWLYKFIIEPGVRLDLLATLDKMNINFGTLYPGLDGFARSLRTNIELLSQENCYKKFLSDFEDF